MYVSEKTLHYAAAFLERYDVQNQSHRDSIKELRAVSNHLLENLYQPELLNVIRQPKAKD